MKVLFDIGHPAHVHYFRNVAAMLEADGHSVLVTARDKDIALDLLDRYEIPYLNRGKGGVGVVKKLTYLARADLWMLRQARAFRPDVLLGFSSPYPAHAARVLGRPYIGITDTEHSVWQQRLFVPFSKWVVTPACFEGSFGAKHVTFDSYMEMAYLAPSRFQADSTVLDELGVGQGERFTIVRFVGWEASHDRGHAGLSLSFKQHAVEEFARRGKVFISSEKALPAELEQFRSPLPVDRMHDAMAFASLVYGESATMTSEAAVLGTPAIYHDDVGRGYTNEQEAVYGHVARFDESADGERQGLERALSVLDDPDSKQAALAAAARLHRERVDTSDFLLDFILQVGGGR